VSDTAQPTEPLVLFCEINKKIQFQKILYAVDAVCFHAFIIGLDIFKKK
jgi:hypothetical protein